MTGEIVCHDCGKDLYRSLEIYACDTDCKVQPLCEDCYNDNHAEGGCAE